MLNGSTSITGPVVVGVNQTVSIRCRAKNTVKPGTLQDLSWRSGTHIQPVVGVGETSDYDVYVERVAGQNGSGYTEDWVRVLHFKRILSSSAGMYTCLANYERVSRMQSMKIQISGE